MEKLRAINRGKLWWRRVAVDRPWGVVELRAIGGCREVGKLRAIDLWFIYI